jgi:arginyl-tRNA--protein-N-Asp/Glu arginylyltransferase
MRLVPLDERPHQCGYLPDRDATYEAYLVLEASPMEREALLEAGYRSFGKYYFRPKCVGCQQCVPLRVPVAQFAPTKSQRRVWRRCQQVVDVVIDTPRYTQEKWEIYHDHLQRFNRPGQGSSPEDFAFSFYDPTIPALEFCYHVDGQLVAVGIVNVTPHALSSVYFTYRLSYAKLSLGTFSAIAEIEHARRLGKDHVYLGYYVGANHFMAYKARYLPNEILTASGQWISFYDAIGNLLVPAPHTFPPYPCLEKE